MIVECTKIVHIKADPRCPMHSEPVLYCYLDGAIYTDLYKFSKNILSDLKIFPLNWPDQSLVKAQSKVRQTVTKQNSPKITTKTT